MNACPFCKSPVKPGWDLPYVHQFQCGTFITPQKPDRHDQTIACAKGEVGLKDARIAALEAAIKRAEVEFFREVSDVSAAARMMDELRMVKV